MLRYRAFTLPELIIVIAIFVIVFSAAGLSLSTFVTRNQLDETAHDMVQALRKAQIFSIQRIRDSRWGVFFDSTGRRFILFRGSAFAARDSTSDEIHELAQTLVLENIVLNGGGSEVVFIKATGETVQTGSFELSGPDGRYTIIINSLGQTEFNFTP